jgi:hypothetical protein
MGQEYHTFAFWLGIHSDGHSIHRLFIAFVLLSKEVLYAHQTPREGADLLSNWVDYPLWLFPVTKATTCGLCCELQQWKHILICIVLLHPWNVGAYIH